MKEKQDFAHVIMKHVPELIVDRRRVYETTERRIRGDVYMANKSYFRDGTLLFRKGMKDVYARRDGPSGRRYKRAMSNRRLRLLLQTKHFQSIAQFKIIINHH